MIRKEDLEQIMGHDAYAAAAGIEVLVAAPGYAELRMAVRPDLLNGHGKVHGGAIYTLADYASAVASNMLGERTTATEGSISYLRGVKEGTLIAKAKTLKYGRRMNFQSVEIFNTSGDLVAVFKGSAIRVSRTASDNDQPGGEDTARLS